MIGENPLDRKVFQDELDFKTLENILETLDHVTPKKVSRQEFNNLNGNFLVETGDDKFGKSYDLFLPDDLVHGELLHLIDFLSRKFGIENYTPYDRIFTQTKIMVGIVLRGLGNEEGEKELRSLASKYNISDEFIKRILEYKTSFGETRNILRGIKAKRKYNGKIGSSEEDIILGFEELKDVFGEEFDLTFFRKGVNMLRLGMMTITQAEQEEKIRYCEENGFEKHINNSGVIIYRKGKEKIIVRTVIKNISEQEKLLREKIGIEQLKEKLQMYKEAGNDTMKILYEMYAVKDILEVLLEYFYQVTKNNFGYQPNKIFKYKETHCVGFSLLGHAFLSELGIEHYGLDLPNHSAIKIIIGGKNYYFDATSDDKNLKEFNYNGCEYGYDKMVFKDGTILYSNSGNCEKVLLSAIYNNYSLNLKNGEALISLNKALKLNPNYQSIINKGIILSKTGRYKEAMEIFDTIINNNIIILNVEAYNSKGIILDKIGKHKEAIKIYSKAIELNPNYLETYNNKGIALRKIGKYKLSILYSYTSKLLEGNSSFMEILYRKEKAKIKKLIDSKDFEGLRLYLLELEQEDN